MTRSEFEAWVRDQGCDTDGAWSAWQGAWNRRAAMHGRDKTESPEPVAWRSRGYGQYKTGKPGPWGYRTGAERPKLNDPSCCDVEPLYAAPGAGTNLSVAQKQLAKFYAVSTLAELVDAQAYHIEKLQAKLPPTPSLAPQRVREG